MCKELHRRSMRGMPLSVRPNNASSQESLGPSRFSVRKACKLSGSYDGRDDLLLHKLIHGRPCPVLCPKPASVLILHHGQRCHDAGLVIRPCPRHVNRRRSARCVSQNLALYSAQEWRRNTPFTGGPVRVYPGKWPPGCCSKIFTLLDAHVEILKILD